MAVNRKTRTYYNDIRAIKKATGLSHSAARSAWRALAYTKGGDRVPRPDQVKAHRKEQRRQKRAKKSFDKAATKKPKGGSGSGKASVIDLYQILGRFAEKGFKIEYATPGATGEVKPDNSEEGRAQAQGQDAAREIKLGMDPLMKEHAKAGVNWTYWRTEPHFQVDWDDDTKGVSVLWIGPNVGG